MVTSQVSLPNPRTWAAGDTVTVPRLRNAISVTSRRRSYAAGDQINVRFSYNTTGYSGNGNGANALSIAGLRLKASMAPDSNGTNTQSINSFYAATIGKLGIEKNQNGSRLETKEFLIAQMDSEQASISGVSLDEEMTNMIKFENSYRASARFISTVSSMMDILMGIGQ